MKPLRYGSVCSGIEAASVAWEPLGWEPAWFCEIDPFASALLAHRYPGVPNHGDFTRLLDPAHTVHESPIDVLVGGTPCQDFSVAGLRAGVEGDRGSLTLDFCRLVGVLRPKWVVWENVPGVLSSDGGRALGAFLGALAELGYGFAYRVLDAQYFGLAQRRKRVFVVGCAGAQSSRAGAVLLEPESVRGDPPARRKARKEAPADAGGRAAEPGGHVVAPPLTATNDPSRSPQSAEVTAQVSAVVHATMGGQAFAFNGYARTVGDVATPLMAEEDKKVEIGVLVPGGEVTITRKDVANTLDASYYKGAGSHGADEREYIAQVAFGCDLSQKAEGIAFSEEFQPCIAGHDKHPGHGSHVLSVDLQNVALGTDVAGTLDTTRPSRGGGQAVITLQDTRGMDKKQNGKGWSEDDLAYTVDAMATQGVAYPLLEVGKRTGASTEDVRCGIGIGAADDPMFTLQRGAQHGVALVGQLVGDRNDPGVSVQEEIHPPLCANPMSDRAPFVGVMAFDYKQSGGDAVLEMAPTLRATPHANTWANGGGHVGIVNVEHGLHTSGNLEIREVSEPITASERKGHSVVLQEEEPMTFDWQAGGGQTGEFQGGTRVYITDPPGRTRALNACKTLAVLQPESQGFDILGTPATEVGKETEVHTPLRARTPGQFENSTVTVVVTEAVAFTTRGREDGLAVESQDELAYALKNPGSGGRTNDRMVATAEAFAFQPRIGRNGRGQPEPISPTLNGAYAGATSDRRPCVVQPTESMAFDTYNQSVSEVTHTLRDPNGTLSDAIPAVMQPEELWQQTCGCGHAFVGPIHQPCPACGEVRDGWTKGDPISPDTIGFYPTGGTHGVSAIEDRSPTLKLGSGQGGNAPGVCFKASHFTRGKDGAPSEISPPLSADADRGDQDTLVFTSDGLVADPISANEGKTYTHEGNTFRMHNCVSAISFEPRYYNRDNKTGGKPSDTVTLTASASKVGDAAPHVATLAQSPTLAFKAGQSEAAGGTFVTDEFSPTLQAQNNGSTAVPSVLQTTTMAVRRLTPRECERLQGFSDDWTLIPYRKGESSDSNRYRALGNSMAVPVMRWIGARIARVDGEGEP